MDENGTPISDPNLLDPQKNVQLLPADNMPTTMPNPSPTSTQQRSNTSQITIMKNDDGKKEHDMGDVSPRMDQRQNSQPWHRPFVKWKTRIHLGPLVSRRPLHRRHLLIVASLLMLAFVVGFSWLGMRSNQASAPLTLAMVTTTSGPQAPMGLEALHSVQLYINTINQAGGVNGHPIQLQVFDDRFDTTVAQQVARQVVASPSLLVLGPIYSGMALPTNPIYRDAHLPLITGTVSSDLLTRDNPSAFRLRTPLTSQGNMSASYVRQILDVSTATVIYTDDPSYGKPTAEAFIKPFAEQGGTITQSLPLAQNPTSSQLDAMAATLAQNPNPGIIYVSALEEPTRDVTVALRRHGVTAPIFCTTASGSDHFAESFASYPEESQQPGYFTDNVYAPAPVIFDSSPDQAQAFATQYQQTYGNAPGWPGAMFYESAQVAVAALKAANVQGTSDSLSLDRARIVKQLAAMTSLQTSVEGIDGPVYFDGDRNAVLPIRFGQFLHRRLRSLPIQLVPVSNPALIDLPKQKSAGEIIQVENQYFWRQRVIYTGIDINKINSINMTTSTFSADFYLWMRYSDIDDATAIAFTNASNVSFDPTMPLDSQTIDGLQYRLYHVTGDFKVNYDLHQYPFDQQQLSIGFQNTRLTNDHLVYVIDAQGLRLQEDNTLDPTVAKATLQSLSSWMYLSTQYASDTFTSSSTLGNPGNFDLRTQTDFSGLQVTMTVQRKSLAYLTSHLLPLALLYVLVYASLFLRLKHLGDRLALTVTALLASAVLLLSVNGELPEIGYVVSLDYIYYIFFLLCLVCIVVSMLMERLNKREQAALRKSIRRKLASSRRKSPLIGITVPARATTQKRTATVYWINIGLHTTYLAVVTTTIIYYLITYGNRLA